jgi:ubiquinone/menaquinone biosynthesis C-methylase UbiE
MSHSHDLSEHDYATANRAYFDEASSKYDEVEGAIALSKRLHSHIIAQYPFSADTTTVLDYACGTGMAPQIFLIPRYPGLICLYRFIVQTTGL